MIVALDLLGSITFCIGKALVESLRRVLSWIGNSGSGSGSGLFPHQQSNG
jgi:hypothetical protein